MLSKSDMHQIQAELFSYDKAREQLQTLTRTVTRLCSWSIIQVHRGNLSQANKTLSEAKDSLDELQNLLSSHSELPQFGQVLVAFQEYAEAKLLLDLKRNGKLATLREVGTSSTAYLLGMLDFVGEMRRMILDSLRRGKEDEAQTLLSTMESIYEDLMSLDRTSILPNYRHKLDAARRILEATRGDVATDLRRVSLEKALRSVERKLGSKSRESHSGRNAN
jgi:translin